MGISSGKKGKTSTSKMSRSRKIACMKSLVLARAGRLNQRKNPQQYLASAISHPTNIALSHNTVVGANSGIATDFSSPEPDHLHGATFDNFMNKRLDFRHWGTRTYQGFKESGAEVDLQRLLAQYEAATNKSEAHCLIVCPDELPLNEKSSAQLATRVLAVAPLLENIGKEKQITSASDAISARLHSVSSTLIRSWTLQFIHNHGLFSNVGYAKRASAGLSANPVAVEKMTTWMIAQEKENRGQRHTSAKDFAKFVDAEFGTKISSSTAQVWLRKFGFQIQSQPPSFPEDPLV